MGLYYDSGVQTGNTATFDHITAYFTTPATLGASPNIQLLNVTASGDNTIDFANVTLNTSARKAKVFLFAGQSNMTGMGVYSDLTSADLASVSNCLAFAADPSHTPPIASPSYFQYWLPPQGYYSNYISCYTWNVGNLSWNVMNPGQYPAQSNFGPEFTSVRDLATGLGEPIYFMKYALAGTGLDSTFSTLYGTWYPSATDPGSPAEYTLNLYKSMVQWAIKARATARQTEPEAEIAGFFWLQGETDATGSSTASRYNANLTSFISRLRSDLGVSTLPIVIGRITTISWQYATTVRAAEVNVANADSHAAWVDTDNLPMDPTYNNHYSGAGLEIIGQRFASAWLNLKQPPSVQNSSGAINILDSSASLTGSLTATGGVPTQVTIYWGATDGGTNSAAWTSNSSLGTLSVGIFAYTASNLKWGATYFYRAMAQNSYGSVWAPVSASFTTLPVTLTCPGNVTVSANAGQCYATGVALGTPTVNNNPGGLTVMSNAPASYPLGATVVTWTVTDGSGNTATCTQQVIVRDTTPPTLIPPARIIIHL